MLVGQVREDVPPRSRSNDDNGCTGCFTNGDREVMTLVRNESTDAQEEVLRRASFSVTEEDDVDRRVDDDRVAIPVLAHAPLTSTELHAYAATCSEFLRSSR